MTHAVKTLLDHLFGTWRLHQVEIRAAVDNTRSRAIPERLAFTQEGVARETEQVGGRYVDLAAYASVDAVAPQTGETVVISAAAGGVGSVAVHLARRTGARVIVLLP